MIPISVKRPDISAFKERAHELRLDETRLITLRDDQGLKTFLDASLKFLDRNPNADAELFAHHLMGKKERSLPPDLFKAGLHTLHPKDLSPATESILYDLLSTHRYNSGFLGFVFGKQEDGEKTKAKLKELYALVNDGSEWKPQTDFIGTASDSQDQTPAPSNFPDVNPATALFSGTALSSSSGALNSPNEKIVSTSDEPSRQPKQAAGSLVLLYPYESPKASFLPIPESLNGDQGIGRDEQKQGMQNPVSAAANTPTEPAAAIAPENANAHENGGGANQNQKFVPNTLGNSTEKMFSENASTGNATVASESNPARSTEGAEESNDDAKGFGEFKPNENSTSESSTPPANTNQKQNKKSVNKETRPKKVYYPGTKNLWKKVTYDSVTGEVLREVIYDKRTGDKKTTIKHSKVLENPTD